MNRVSGYGLVLLAASGIGARHAVAGGVEAAQSTASYFVGAAASGAPASHSAQGYLGVDVHDVNGDQTAVLRLKEPRGAEIVLVDHDAPAGKAGLREHDVVLRMNGQAIEGAEQIKKMLHDSPPGRTIILLISRDGQQMTVTTQMANREEVERKAWEQHLSIPEPPEPPPGSESAGSAFSPAPAPSATAPHGGNSFIGTILLMSPSYTGAMLEPLNPQLAQFFGAASGKGLLVRSVAENSPAAQAGMQVGDVVVRADAKPVASTGDWSKAVKNSHGKPLNIVVLRDKKEQTLTLTPDGKKRSSMEPPPQNDSDGPAIARLGLSRLPQL